MLAICRTVEQLEIGPDPLARRGSGPMASPEAAPTGAQSAPGLPQGGHIPALLKQR